MRTVRKKLREAIEQNNAERHVMKLSEEIAQRTSKEIGFQVFRQMLAWNFVHFRRYVEDIKSNIQNENS